MPHELAELAFEAVKNYLRTGKEMSPPPGSRYLKEKAGVFVSFKKKGMLRGCIGTFSPALGNIAEETIRNAISAAVCDPRFPPVSYEELPGLTLSVDVLSEPEPAGANELDAKKYGVIVQAGHKRGLLLPDLEGVDTVETQIDIAKQKAGISHDEPCKLYKFKVRRYN